MTHIVKRRGHKEPFDEKKVYASAYSACRNAHLSEPEAEKIADEVMKKVTIWVDNKSEISSSDIFSETTKALTTTHAAAGFLYETHRDLA